MTQVATLPGLLSLRLEQVRARSWRVYETCLTCGDEFTWSPTSQGSKLGCSSCGIVATRLSRGVSIKELPLESDHSIHEDDRSLLSARLLARLGEKRVDPFTAELILAEFLLLLSTVVEARSGPLADPLLTGFFELSPAATFDPSLPRV